MIMNESPAGKGGIIVRQEYSHHTGRIWHAALVLSSVVMFALSASTAESQMQSPYTVVHNFDCTLYASGPAADGCTPDGPGYLAQGRDGNLYGTVPTGGNLMSPKVNGGTIFSVGPTAPFSFAVRYTLGTNTNDGSTSHSGLSLGMDGIFYGTAERGGNGKGSVFSLGNGFSTLQPVFTDGMMDGGFPWAPPMQAPDGNLYGVTNGGTNKGVIYRVTTNGISPVTAPFGVNTTAALVLGFDGNLYGTTQAGSATAQGGFSNIGGGTIFRIPMSGSGTVKPVILHTFNSMNKVVDATGQMVNDGSAPKGPVMFGQDGNLYGTTSAGGSGNGVIYQLNPNTGAYKILHTFPLVGQTSPDGSASESGLVQGSDGFLFGVTKSGGANGAGTLFKVSTAGTGFQVLWSFGNGLQCGMTMSNDGSNPVSTPTLHTNGKIYGMTQSGGCRKAYGTVYSFDAGLKPFASIVGGSRWVNAGSKVGVIGQGFNSTTGVLLGSSTPLGKLSVQLFSDTYMEVTVPKLIGPSPITILMPSGNVVTPQVVTTSAPQCGTVMFGCRILAPIPFTPR